MQTAPDTIAPVKGKRFSLFLIISAIFAIGVYSYPCWTITEFLVGGRVNLMSEEFYMTTILSLAISGMILTVPTVGIVAMLIALRALKNKTTVKAWSLLAAALAPFCAFAYLRVSDYLLSLTKYTEQFRERHTGFDNQSVFISALGFYMPFVLLTYWLKYKYRQDEF